MSQQSQVQVTYQYLLDWQRKLLSQENEITNRQCDLKKYETDLFALDDFLKLEKKKLKDVHCRCCRYNSDLPLIQSDTFFAEWSVFKKGINNNESKIGLASIGEVYISQTFCYLFNQWLTTETGKCYQGSKLIGVYVTKLELSWMANDWKGINDVNSKLIICEKAGRHKIKFIIE